MKEEKKVLRDPWEIGHSYLVPRLIEQPPSPLSIPPPDLLACQHEIALSGLFIERADWIQR